MASGLQDIPLRRIPDKWDPKWFADFVRDVLRFADVRNMRVANEMTLDGQSSDFATLSMSLNGIELDKIAQQAALSVIGNPTGSTGTLQAITAGSDGHVFRRSGATVGFGTILAAAVSNFDEAAQDAVGAALTDTASINLTYTDVTNAITADVLPAGVNHDALLNYVAAQHVSHTGVTLTAGNGLTGGGDISASRTFDVGAGTGITVNANDVALANMAQATIKGRASGAGTGAPTDLSATDVATIVSTAVATALNIGSIANYTPTLTNVTNLDSSAANTTFYIRLSNFVIVFGNLAANATAAGACQLDLSIPVASAIQSTIDLGGVAFCGAVAGFGAAIVGESVNDRASMTWIATDTNNRTLAFIFGYRVI